MPTGPVPHGSGASIGGEHLRGLLIGLGKCAVYDRGLVWGDLPESSVVNRPSAGGPYIGHTYPILFLSKFCKSNR